MKQIKFYDIENDCVHFGILTDEGDIICGCCGGLIPSDEIGDTEDCTHKIIKIYDNWKSLDDQLESEE